MLLVLSMDYPGEPVPKGRPRFGPGRVYTPSRTRQAEEALGWALKAAYKPALLFPEGVLFEVELMFFCRVSSDVDNLAKLVLDCLNPKKTKGRLRAPGLIWQDDRQVVLLRAGRVDDALSPHTSIRIWTFERWDEQVQREALGCVPSP